MGLFLGCSLNVADIYYSDRNEELATWRFNKNTLSLCQSAERQGWITGKSTKNCYSADFDALEIHKQTTTEERVYFFSVDVSNEIVTPFDELSEDNQAAFKKAKSYLSVHEKHQSHPYVKPFIQGQMQAHVSEIFYDDWLRQDYRP